MSEIKVLKAFQFEVTEEPKSIYPFSPVYKVEQNGRSYIVKKTRSPMDKAMSIVHFTEKLHGQGVSIVSPVQMNVPNPQQIDELVWVVYPFINGKKYTGKDEEIYQAGRQLGHIQSLSSVNNAEGLSTYSEFDFEEGEILKDFEKIKVQAKKRGLVLDFSDLKDELLCIIKGQQILKRLELPSVATPNDYKANNLIYNDNAEPFLIDPDNAVFLPRIYDLALTLLLFHNEMETAPDKLFDPRQWELFKKGYSKFVKLTETEKENWQAVLKHVYLDEVIWLMAEVEEDWDNPNQIGLFESLLAFLTNTEAYDL